MVMTKISLYDQSGLYVESDMLMLSHGQNKQLAPCLPSVFSELDLYVHMGEDVTTRLKLKY